MGSLYSVAKDQVVFICCVSVNNNVTIHVGQSGNIS